MNLSLIYDIMSKEATLPWSLEHFESLCKTAEVTPIIYRDEEVGAVIIRDGMIHVVVDPAVRGKWLNRRLIREILGGALKRHEVLYAPIHKDNWRSQWFTVGLGFDPVSIHGDYVIYRRDRHAH